MNKIIIVLMVCSSAFMISCKKEHTCNCTTYTSDPETGSPVESKSSSTLNATEKDAEIWCSGKSTSSFDPSGGLPTSATTCELTN